MNGSYCYYGFKRFFPSEFSFSPPPSSNTYWHLLCSELDLALQGAVRQLRQSLTVGWCCVGVCPGDGGWGGTGEAFLEAGMDC